MPDHKRRDRETDKQKTNIRTLSLHNTLFLVLKEGLKNEYIVKSGTQRSCHISVNVDSRCKPSNTTRVPYLHNHILLLLLLNVNVLVITSEVFNITCYNLYRSS